MVMAVDVVSVSEWLSFGGAAPGGAVPGCGCWWPAVPGSPDGVRGGVRRGAGGVAGFGACAGLRPGPWPWGGRVAVVRRLAGVGGRLGWCSPARLQLFL